MSAETGARWLFHVRLVGEAGDAADTTYGPASLAREGFIHASFQDAVLESARLYFPEGAALEVLRSDPRRLDVPLEIAPTPRGAMPHIHGAIPRDAIRETVPLAHFAAAPVVDRVTGTRFAFVAFEGMTLLDLVGVLDPISRIASMGFDPSASCEVVALREARVWSGAGSTLTAERVRPDLGDVDVLVVPGGPGTRALVHDSQALDWLRTFPENRLVASVCTGALLLGALGRLRGKRATTHANAMGELAAFGATAVSERVVDEGQVVTAGGVTSGLDLGVHLVRRLMGADVASRIARQMEWR